MGTGNLGLFSFLYGSQLFSFSPLYPAIRKYQGNTLPDIVTFFIRSGFAEAEHALF